MPKKRQCENLLIPVCLSASHIAFGSIRMEPVFMILGESAATAAGIALDAGIAVQNVPYEPLKTRLLDQGQILEHAGVRRSQALKRLPGTVVDDQHQQAEREGAWRHSTAVHPYWSQGYHHDDNARKGECQAVFTADLEPGTYEVRVIYQAHPNRAAAVPVTVEHLV